MCGIAGILGLPPEVALEMAPRMLRALAHRGPDDRGTQVVHWPGGVGGHPAVLLQARLSILDLTMQDHPARLDSALQLLAIVMPEDFMTRNNQRSVA